MGGGYLIDLILCQHPSVLEGNGCLGPCVRAWIESLEMSLMSIDVLCVVYALAVCLTPNAGPVFVEP